jgi:hypothetical protein
MWDKGSHGGRYVLDGSVEFLHASELVLRRMRNYEAKAVRVE